MANWYGTARSNYFEVKNQAAFLAWVNGLPDISTQGRGQKGEPTQYMIYSNSHDDGGWPTWRWAEEGEEDTELNLVDEIAPHLKHGVICVLMEAGAEKLRYISGNAIAFNSLGNYIELALSDIYQQAYDVFKIHPTEASY